MDEDEVVITEVNNPNLRSLANQMDRMIEEIQAHWSSGINEWDEFQRERVVNLLEAAKGLKDYFVDSQRKVDITKTSNRVFKLEAHPEVVDLENESSNILVNMVVTWRDEMLQGGSNKRPYGMEEHDSARFDQHYERVIGFIEQWIDVHLPQDFAASSPREANNPDARTGLHGTGD